MSEETTTETQTQDAPAEESVDMNALAAEAMGLDLDEGDQFDDDEGGDDDGEPMPAAAEAAEETPSEEPAEAAPEPEPSKPKVVEPDAQQKKLDAMMARAEQRERQALERAIDAEKRAALVERERDELKEQAKVVDVFKTDPVRGLEIMARAAGIEPEKAWQEIVERRTEGRSGLELERLRAEFDSKLEAQKKAYEEQLQQQTVVSHQRKVAAVVRMQGDPGAVAKYPHLLSLEPTELQRRIDMAYRNAAEKPHLAHFAEAVNRDALLTELEKYEESLYLQREQRRGASAPAPQATGGPAAAPPEYSEAPSEQAPDAATSRRQSRTITNDDTATGSGARRQKSARQLRAELNALAEANI